MGFMGVMLALFVAFLLSVILLITMDGRELSSHMHQFFNSDTCYEQLHFSPDDMEKKLRSKHHDFCLSESIDQGIECQCLNPFVQVPRKDDEFYDSWMDEHEQNVAKAQERFEIGMLGGSDIERFQGSRFGDPFPDYFPIRSVFDFYFSENEGSDLKAMELGLTEDRIPNLLWRLTNGEIAKHPPMIWWVLIGETDLADGCHVESVLMGILNVVKYLRHSCSKSTIVINSLLPSTSATDGVLGEEWSDIHWINSRLECFAHRTSRVDFYNATEHFLIPNNPSKIGKILMEDYKVPTPLGYRKWAQGIHNHAKKILGT
eukprot:CAMPEP_0118673552 /NCGR_PEP_ID=MMETSP0800-20121206/391_1 /TAXON_ID=210618 ORGANISM="Striatella unipunctata, Strain CCMP2910" /NCGR_SAMPLE_ID=MMETSP0800 /ASSEMBLY_ACC=CAM_ASM_000638 /LENGTH=316 /DNA_ID=CAMNT_0006568639 /DNA_START=1 /DNA_END=951 /DNA_ORIENTATION=-